MILTCTECDTSFNFDDRLIKPSGSKVRCSKCQSVFVAYPQDGSAAAEAADAGGGAAASSAAAGLDDLDLDAITADLDLDEGAAAQPGEEVSSDDELDFDLGLDDDVAGAPASADTQFQETQELDLTDFDLDESTDATETPAADGDLGFDLDLDQTQLSDAPTQDLTNQDTATAIAPDLDFDLGFDAETDEQESDTTAAADAGGDEDLDFSLDLDLDAEPEAAAPDAELMDETRAMDPGEFDDLLAAGAESDQDAGAEDIELDFDAEAKIDPVAEDSTDEIDFDLGLDDEGDAAAGPVLEETEELDLADLEGMIEGGEEGAGDAAEEQATDEFDLDLDVAEAGEQEAAAEDIPMEETEELDLSGLEDALELDESAGDSVDAATEDLDLDLDFESGEEPAVADDIEEDDEGDFDLTDLDDMLELEDDEEEDAEEAEEVEEVAEGDFDLELDIEEEADDDLEFEVEDDESVATTVAADTQQAVEDEDSFDMGDMEELDEADGEEVYLDDDDMDYTAGKPAKKAGRAISRPIKILLVLFLLFGGGYGAVTLMNFFGMDIPFADAIREMEIPYVSELFGPTEPGNLNIAIIEKQLRGKFIENNNLGTLYVVRGRVKNNYKHPRSYINLIGKLYTKGGNLKQTKSVYAGSTMSDKKLAEVTKAQLTRQANNRNGRKRSNVNIPPGKVLPFMIVFSNLPANPDEYSVEVASSEKTR